MAQLNPFARRKQKLSQKEIDSVLHKIRAEYDKYIVTYHKSAALKEEFERRLRIALIESRDMERFLSEEIAAVRSIYELQEELDRKQMAAREKSRLKALRKEQPDFADKVLEELKSRITAYPKLNVHREASYEIVHLYGAIEEFERKHWPEIDRFIGEYRSWALKGERKDFNLLLWRFVPAAEGKVPPILEKYCLLLDSPDKPLKELNFEAQQCIKEAAFLLNDILWSVKQIISQGIDGRNIEKNLDFVQNVINDFRIRDLKNR